jgi:uncharacterized protein YggT (Ycf19 family)
MITPQLLILFGNILISFIEGVIGLRILLKLMGASASAPFVYWVYETSKPLLYPFEGMFPSSHVAGVPFTIEFSALFALFVYIFIGYVFQEMFGYIEMLKLKKDDKKNEKSKE